MISRISFQYFGGTNFGRTAGGPLVATSYDYDAPIDEYGKLSSSWLENATSPFVNRNCIPSSYAGFLRQPKWGHLRDLHKAIKHCEEYLISSDPTQLQLGVNLEVANIFSLRLCHNLSGLWMQCLYSSVLTILFLWSCFLLHFNLCFLLVSGTYLL